MKVFLFATILQSFAIVGFGQNKVSTDTSKCGTLLNRLSENWKLDSTGNNDFVEKTQSIYFHANNFCLGI